MRLDLLASFADSAPAHRIEAATPDHLRRALATIPPPPVGAFWRLAVHYGGERPVFVLDGNARPVLAPFGLIAPAEAERIFNACQRSATREREAAEFWARGGFGRAITGVDDPPPHLRLVEKPRDA